VEPVEETCGNGRDEDCDGEDEILLDQYDDRARNESCMNCTMLNSEDDPDINQTVFATLHNAADIDFYCFYGDDGVNPIEHVRIQLQNIPNGRDYDVFLYDSLDDCLERNDLANSINPDNQDEEISWRETPVYGDTGWFYVKVIGVGRSQSCFLNYELTINGLN